MVMGDVGAYTVSTSNDILFINCEKGLQKNSITMEEILMIDILKSIPLPILLPVIIIEFILLIVALVDCIKAEKTNGPKFLWIFIIIFINTIGPILYFIVGRKQNL